MLNNILGLSVRVINISILSTILCLSGFGGMAPALALNEPLKAAEKLEDLRSLEGKLSPPASSITGTLSPPPDKIPAPAAEESKPTPVAPAVDTKTDPADSETKKPKVTDGQAAPAASEKKKVTAPPPATNKSTQKSAAPAKSEKKAAPAEPQRSPEITREQIPVPDLSQGAAIMTEDTGMCRGQTPVTQREFQQALDIMDNIRSLKNLSAAEEEALVRGGDLTTERMNCVLGKFMAAEDIFSWGTPSAYGVSLSPEEMAAAAKFSDRAMALKKYLEEDLNLRAE